MITETKFTPGPWKMFSNPKGVVGVTAIGVSDVAHCSGLHQLRSREEEEANSTLIATAPRLYYAASDLREAQKAYMADRGNEELGRAVGEAAANLDAALAEARGEES